MVKWQTQLYTTKENKEVSAFLAGDNKAQINRHAQKHNKHKTEQNIKYLQKKYRLGMVIKNRFKRSGLLSVVLIPKMCPRSATYMPVFWWLVHF